MSGNRQLIRALGVAGLIIAGLLVYRWWMRPPALEFENLRYLQLLTTAVSSRNSEWLNKVGHAVDQQHQQGRMSDVELAALRRIMAVAASGEWEQAHIQCHALAEAQLSRRRSRSAAPPHAADH